MLRRRRLPGANDDPLVLFQESIPLPGERFEIERVGLPIRMPPHPFVPALELFLPGISDDESSRQFRIFSPGEQFLDGELRQVGLAWQRLP